MLIAAFIVSLIIAFLMVVVSIDVIGDDPQRVESSHVATGVGAMLIMAAPVIYSAWTTDKPVVWIAALWLSAWLLFSSARAVLKIGKMTRKITPGRGLIFVGLNLSHLAAITLAMANTVSV